MFADPEHCICSGHSAADAITDRILHHVPDRCSIALCFCASCAEGNASRSLSRRKSPACLWRGYRRRLRMDRVALFVTPPPGAEASTEGLVKPGAVGTMNVADLLP